MENPEFIHFERASSSYQLITKPTEQRIISVDT